MANVRIDQVDLVGGDRSIRFEGDLSVVKGSITTEVVRAAMAWYAEHGRPIEAWDPTGVDLWEACEAWERETR